MAARDDGPVILPVDRPDLLELWRELRARHPRLRRYGAPGKLSRRLFQESPHYDEVTVTRIKYLRAVVDLNDDDVDEVLVYVTADDFCGNGGCALLVLTPEGDSFRLVTRLSIVKLPIRVLDTRSNGWRNLSVTVQGGGIVEAYEAELPFDGVSYPRNPSMPPARKVLGAVIGEILIDPSRRQEVDGEILISRSRREKAASPPRPGASEP